MNGWLLLSVHNLDDIPVRLFATKEEALAERPWPVVDDNPLGTWDNSGFIGWKMLEFREGLPVPYADFYDRGEDGAAVLQT